MYAGGVRPKTKAWIQQKLVPYSIGSMHLSSVLYSTKRVPRPFLHDPGLLALPIKGWLNLTVKICYTLIKGMIPGLRTSTTVACKVACVSLIGSKCRSGCAALSFTFFSLLVVARLYLRLSCLEKSIDPSHPWNNSACRWGSLVTPLSGINIRHGKTEKAVKPGSVSF